MDDKLFKSVFNNKFILNYIYKFIKIYKRNEIIEFNNIKQLRDYNEREYISKIKISGLIELEFGDLPIGGVLKEVEFTELYYSKTTTTTNGEAIPYGVEIITFSPSWNIDFSTTQISTLPSTVHTVNNVVLDLTQNKNSNIIHDKLYNQIPLNIKSISFNSSPNISGNYDDNKNGSLSIPSSITNLKFSLLWNNQNVKLRKGDIPSNVESLSLGYYNIKNFKTNNHDDSNILPTTIKQLQISCTYPDSTKYYTTSHIPIEIRLNYTKDLFNFLIPLSNLEILEINNFVEISPDSNLNKCKSIKKLKINNFKASTHLPNSLPINIENLKLFDICQDLDKINYIPNSVTKLELQFYEEIEFIIEKDVIPKSVKTLKLGKLFNENDKFPESLTSLSLLKGYFTDQDIINLIPILPKSLLFLNLPIEFKQFENVSKILNNNNLNFKTIYK